MTNFLSRLTAQCWRVNARTEVMRNYRSSASERLPNGGYVPLIGYRMFGVWNGRAKWCN